MRLEYEGRSSLNQWFGSSFGGNMARAMTPAEKQRFKGYFPSLDEIEPS
jgi:hypothetical protein